MKAKDYFEKYKESLLSTDKEIFKSAALDILKEMAAETIQISKDRKCIFHDSLEAIIKEQNQKYNALVNLVDKNGNMFRLIPNTFRDQREYFLEFGSRRKGEVVNEEGY